MEIVLTPDQEAFVRQSIASGRYQTAEDAVREALARWEEEQRVRAELLAALDQSEADIRDGHYSDYTNTTLAQLAADLKREARALRDHESG